MTRSMFLASIAGARLLAQESLTRSVLVGFPQRRSDNTLGSNETRILETKESKEFICMITFKNGKYYWSSRDQKELIKNASGGFVTFTALDGAGYVKICPAMNDQALDYVEHLSYKLYTLTYWGKSTVYREEVSQ